MDPKRHKRGRATIVPYFPDRIQKNIISNEIFVL